MYMIKGPRQAGGLESLNRMELSVMERKVIL